MINGPYTSPSTDLDAPPEIQATPPGMAWGLDPESGRQVLVHLPPQAAAPVQPYQPVPYSAQQLVQLTDGQWVMAKVPAAPPVIVPAAPEAAPRRPMTRSERSAIIVVSGICALTLSAGAAINMAGAHLESAAHLAFAAATFLGVGVAGWLVLRLTTGSGSRNGIGGSNRPTVTNNITANVEVVNRGFMTRGNATGIGNINRIG